MWGVVTCVSSTRKAKVKKVRGSSALQRRGEVAGLFASEKVEKERRPKNIRNLLASSQSGRKRKKRLRKTTDRRNAGARGRRKIQAVSAAGGRDLLVLIVLELEREKRGSEWRRFRRGLPANGFAETEGTVDAKGVNLEGTASNLGREDGRKSVPYAVPPKNECHTPDLERGKGLR